MLVLSRKIGEKLIITAPSGETITITLCSCVGKSPGYAPKARIGLEAPTTWTIHREEIQKLVDKERD
jgi:carbon storage regulator CsrA